MDTPRPARAKPLGFVIVLALVVLVLVIDMRRRTAENQLAQLSVRLNQVNGANTQQQQEADKKAAQEIVNRVRTLIAIPTDVEPTVATILDAAKLKSQNAFYANSQNGDVLIVTSTRAILYRPSANIIIDVVPVNLTPPPAASSAPAAGLIEKPEAKPAAKPAATKPAASAPAEAPKP